MYRSIVRRLVRQVFQQVNDQDHEAVLARCHPDIHHRFGGDHALGGERHDREHLRQWFARLGRLAPDLRLDVTDIWVTGGPWRTVAVARWTSSMTLADGTPYANHGVHVVTMRWGKAVQIDANEDSLAVARFLDHEAARGIAEAAATPIVS